MIGLNGKKWEDVCWLDIKDYLNDIEESFYFEFKSDDVSAAKLIKEISALANTYGGYIFIGVADDKTIEGCTNWNEQKIHTTIHDSLSPIPQFDIKEFKTEEGKKIIIIKIDEGSEPPYITNKGEICERISSGSFVIKESARLSHMYMKREEYLKKLEQKISIELAHEDVENVLGYIDVGFEPAFADPDKIGKCLLNVSNEKLQEMLSEELQSGNVMRFGNSLLFTCGGLTANKILMPAHLNNFIEIMVDESIRMRGLLINKQPDDGENVNMASVASCFSAYENIYRKIYKDVLENDFIYARKYEKLTVIKQFCPTYHLDNSQDDADVENKEKEIQKIIRKHQELWGIDKVVTSDRIPKVGFYLINRPFIEKCGMEYNLDSIVGSLFACQYIWLGYIEEQDQVFRK